MLACSRLLSIVTIPVLKSTQLGQTLVLHVRYLLLILPRAIEVMRSGLVRAAQIPPDAAERAHIPKNRHKLPKEYGGGYIAFVEVFHQLHCLDLLRKTSYYNYEHYAHDAATNEDRKIDEFTNGEPIIKFHAGEITSLKTWQFLNVGRTLS